MTRIKRIAFIGNSLPRRCGIATFTTDLQQAVAATALPLETTIVAMTDSGHTYSYPRTVGFEVQQERLEDYVHAADYINKNHFDAVSLQHEFGIFGGEAGEHILDLLDRLTVPVVTTLHTVLEEPSAAQRRVLERIIALSARVVVMAEKGRKMLQGIYGTSPAKIAVIPHGIPDFAFVGPEAAKRELGYENRTVILTFGLLSPNKGIEVMIDAMPLVLESRPNAVYVILGATHPNLVRDRGEAYRESLQFRARELGISEHVVFLDQFVDRPTLLQYISMCDVYVTPYLNHAQMTSGTLAYSFGLGNAVVSTPYWHALELLDDEHGIIVPFGDAPTTGLAIASLLDDEPRRQSMRKRAHRDSRHMTWAQVGRQYVSLLEQASTSRRDWGFTQPRVVAAPIALEHLNAMSDGTGLFQHAVHSVPDRSHGYCVDDNARALLLSSSLDADGRERLPETLTSTYAAFVQHAFNPDTSRFRNFMSFDRRWLEPQGSEDSHGRTLWALGVTAHSNHSPTRREWASALFRQALPIVDSFGSPRAWAFTLLGLHAFCASKNVDPFALQLRLVLANRLTALFNQVQTSDWAWLEEGLSYDNARLCEALILTGKASGVQPYGDAGIRMLEWLMERQTGPKGLFRPVGSSGFADIRKPPRPFDQQPLEATATIAACLAAWQMTADVRWRVDANRAFSWFLGSNDLGVSLVDQDSGSCRDGLHPDRANENCGGESVVSYLLSLVDMRQLERTALIHHRFQRLPSDKMSSSVIHKHEFRGRLVSSKLSKPTGALPPA
jgi:glycosyltransferase involved in cell wall biosynthesis